MPPVCACVCVFVCVYWHYLINSTRQPYFVDHCCHSCSYSLMLGCLYFQNLIGLVHVFFSSSSFSFHGFVSHNVNKKNILTHTHTCSDMFFFLYMYHTWWCPSTFRSVCVCVMPIYQIIIWNNNCFPGVQAGTHITKIELLLL